MFTRVCTRPALAEQKHHGLVVTGSGVRSCGRPVRKVAPNPLPEGDLELAETVPVQAKETRSPRLQARPDGARSPAVGPTRSLATFVSPNLSQARGESLLRNSCLRPGIPVSQENLAFFFYFPQIL